MMTTQDVESVQIDAAGIATLRITGGGPLNIISSVVARNLTSTLTSLAQRTDVKVLIIRAGGPKTFVGGADIKQMVALTPDTAKVFIRALHDLCEAVRIFPVPTVAQIDGWCIGVGLELAACCDFRYSSTASNFVMPEVKIGIPSVIQGALLSRLIGEGRARAMMLSGEAIDAQKAMDWGLLSELTEPEALDAAVKHLADGMAACGAVGMRMQKKLLLEWEAPYLAEVVAASIDRFGEVFESPEPHQYLSEFFSRKKAK